MFSALKEGSTVYVLYKENKPKLYVAKVVERKEPVPDMNAPRPMYGEPMPCVMDIVAIAGAHRFEFNAIKANASMVSYKQEAIIADNMEEMGKEWDRILAMSKQAMDSMPYHQDIIDADKEIRPILNPEIARQQEQEEKLGALEGKVSNMETTLTDIRNMLTSALSGNTGTTSRKKE